MYATLVPALISTPFFVLRQLIRSTPNVERHPFVTLSSRTTLPCDLGRSTASRASPTRQGRNHSLAILRQAFGAYQGCDLKIGRVRPLWHREWCTGLISHFAYFRLQSLPTHLDSAGFQLGMALSIECQAPLPACSRGREVSFSLVPHLQVARFGLVVVRASKSEPSSS